MTVDRFQLLITTFLAIASGALGAMALSSPSARGYPAGPTVSYGNNPVVASGGTLGVGGSETLFSAPADQDLIITDVVLTPDTTDYLCVAGLQFNLELGSGASVGSYSMVTKTDIDRGYTSFSQNVISSYASGIRVPAGDSLLARSVERHSYNCSGGSLGVSYAVSGHYVHP